jgi:hypothetical protein
MTELFRQLDSANVRYLLIGGQAMRLFGMPRHSLDWDLYIPSDDQANFEKLNDLLGAELDIPVVPLGERGENFVQTYQTCWLGRGAIPPGTPRRVGFRCCREKSGSQTD